MQIYTFDNMATTKTLSTEHSSQGQNTCPEVNGSSLNATTSYWWFCKIYAAKSNKLLKRHVWQQMFITAKKFSLWRNFLICHLSSTQNTFNGTWALSVGFHSGYSLSCGGGERNMMVTRAQQQGQQYTEANTMQQNYNTL